LDPLKLLDDEIKKLDIEKLLYAFYKERYEDTIEAWHSWREKLEDELKRAEGKLNKDLIQEELNDIEELFAKAPKPEDLEITQELIKTIRDYITDQVLIILTDICENILQGEYKPYLWEESPDIKIREGGAVFVHFRAKAKFVEIINDLAETIARLAGRFIPLKTGIAHEAHIKEASKIVVEKNIALDDLREIIREEMKRVITTYLGLWIKEGQREIQTFEREISEETTDDKAIDIEELRNKILDIPEEELAKEMIAFAKEEYEKHLSIYKRDIPTDLLIRPYAFLIEKFGLPVGHESIEQLRNLLEIDDQVRTKMDKVVSTVRDRLNEEKRRKEVERLAKEKEMLPKLVDECVEWAKALGLKYLKKEHVRTFLTEKNIELSQTMMDALHSSVYTKLLKKK